MESCCSCCWPKAAIAVGGHRADVPTPCPSRGDGRLCWRRLAEYPQPRFVLDLSGQVVDVVMIHRAGECTITSTTTTTYSASSSPLPQLVPQALDRTAPKTSALIHEFIPSFFR